LLTRRRGAGAPPRPPPPPVGGTPAAVPRTPGAPPRPFPPPARSRLTQSLLAVPVRQPVVLGAGLAFLPERGGPPPVWASPVAHFPPSALAFDRQTLGPEPGFRPQITNVKVVDLDRDGRPDVIVCDARRNRV